MKYTEIVPSDKFNNLVLNYWTFEIPEATNEAQEFVHQIMPENTVSIVFINQPFYKGIRLLGPQTERLLQTIYPGSFYLGVRINPWVKIESIIPDKEQLINKTNPAPNFINNLFKEININFLSQNFTDYHLIEKGLLKLIENKKIVIDPLVKYICLQLTQDVKINQLIKSIPLSIRPVQKKFKSTTGMTMSNFRSIHRLQNTTRMVYLNKDSIVEAAFENNYTDHSHFINTFKKYMKISFKEFLLKTESIELFT
ncbi:MAG: helix-turn-helix transcriptional regulator [Flavobacteriaceae bacterium]|nr:helix-turn-helix transcriptional regulator [Flavobacteriaceae bacterium]